MRGNKQKTMSKMVDFNPIISIIMLKINIISLYIPIKDKLSDKMKSKT